MQPKPVGRSRPSLTTNHCPLTTPRSGFTLVELLVVIVIIGILAGLITVGAMAAMVAAKNTRIKTEVDNLHGAMEAYKQKYGEYPPSNMTDRAALIRHISRAFPRSNPAATGAILPPVDTTPAEALTIFLNGFTADPQNPLSEPYTDVNGNGKWDSGEPLMDWDGDSTHDGGQIATGSALFTFDKGRMSVGQRGYLYKPQGLEAPFAYFRVNDWTSATYIPFYEPLTQKWKPDGQTLQTGISNVNGIAVSYFAAPTGATPPNQLANTDSIQIVSSGLDNDFGTVLMKSSGLSAPQPTSIPDSNAYKVFPTGTNYSVGDNDNITNFNERKTLDDARP